MDVLRISSAQIFAAFRPASGRSSVHSLPSPPSRQGPLQCLQIKAHGQSLFRSMGTLKVSFKSFQLNYPRISSHSLLIPSPNLLFRLSRSGCPAILNISSLKIGLDGNFRLSCSAFRRPTETRYFLYEYSRKGRRYLAQSTQQRSVQIIPTYPSQRKQYRELPSWPVEVE